MANFARTQIDAVWVTGYQVPVTDLEDLDRKCFQGINGVVGGVYSPTAEIIVVGGGFGLRLAGPLDIRASGKLRFTTGATLTLADSDYQDYATGHPGRTRTIYQAMAPVRVVGNDHFAVANVIPEGGVQPLASELRRSTGAYVPEFVKELRVHDGAKLARVRLRFKVPTPHASVPQEMPKVRLFRTKNSDGITTNLCATTKGDGFVPITTPSSGVAWYADGAAQEFVITCDQNHTIDDDNYTYYAHVVEERAGVPEYPYLLDIYEAAVIDVASTADNPAFVSATVDGVAGWGATAAEIALFKDQTNKYENGLYVRSSGGAWARVASLNSGPQFRNGMLFEVLSYQGSGDGLANTGTIWQMTLPPPFVLGTSNIVIGQPVAKGTVFLGMVLEYESITSTKFQ